VRCSDELVAVIETPASENRFRVRLSNERFSPRRPVPLSWRSARPTATVSLFNPCFADHPIPDRPHRSLLFPPIDPMRFVPAGLSLPSVSIVQHRAIKAALVLPAVLAAASAFAQVPPPDMTARS